MEDIINNIYKNPEDWTVNEHTFKHKSSLQIWTAGGFLSVHICQKSVYITFLQKIRIWRAFKWWSKNAPLSTISNIKRG